MIAIKGMDLQTDCQKCRFMATDGADTLLSPMMCVALWATKHEIKHCVKGKILDDCPLVEIVTCKDCKHCDFDDSDQTFFCNTYGNIVCSSHFCSNGKRRE